ncbi:MAG: tRNA 5-methoxyuridine(34)/uridine 5-oxyacetic acid(34) synthase CmoB [Arenicella sp.]|nr:tRNA 5-methoxyuridine(34)/uridine 5-oxyacetic acid(34) synthase CmoB [Arenicella sp.]
MAAKSAIRIIAGHQVINFDDFYRRSEFSAWRNHFATAIKRRANPARHGDLSQWLNELDKLPPVMPSIVELDSDAIKIGDRDDLNDLQAVQLYDALYALRPWRKGPYNLFGTYIDSEWRSDWKWQRLSPHIADLHGRRVLDVGCGNGYHCWRILGAGAHYVLGIDPSMRFLVQHLAVQHYARDARFDLLPLGIEDMPADLAYFDTVLSMGVLYHRRHPVAHLQELYGLLQPGGELVLETLIVDEAEGGILTPQDRYAMMRNVWSIMTVEKILQQLAEAGFEEGRCADENRTSRSEQRCTHWMQFHSLADFLDPADREKTIEGYPAPKRALFIARKAV